MRYRSNERVESIAVDRRVDLLREAMLFAVSLLLFAIVAGLVRNALRG